MEIVVPVAAYVGDDIVASFVDARLSIANEEQAPVVVEWDDHRPGRRTHRFRAWNGGLVGDGMSEIGLDWLGPRDASEWRKAKLHDRDWSMLIRQPYEAWAGILAAGASRIVQDPSDHPELEAVAHATVARVAESVVIDGRIWLGTDGPTMTIFEYRKAPIGIMTNEPEYLGHRVRRQLLSGALSAFDWNDLAERVRRRFGGSVHGEAPRIISYEGWDVDAIRARADEIMLRCVLSDMAVSASHAVGTMPIEAVEAVLEVREASNAEAGSTVQDMLPVAKRYLSTMKEGPHFGAEERHWANEWEILLGMAESRDIHAPELQGFSV